MQTIATKRLSLSGDMDEDIHVDPTTDSSFSLTAEVLLPALSAANSEMGAAKLRISASIIFDCNSLIAIPAIVDKRRLASHKVMNQ